jgi:hypothetical protein
VFEFWAGGKPGTAAPGPYCEHIIMAPNNTYQAVRTETNLKYVDFRPYEDIQEASVFAHVSRFSLSRGMR